MPESSSQSKYTFRCVKNCQGVFDRHTPKKSLIFFHTIFYYEDYYENSITRKLFKEYLLFFKTNRFKFNSRKFQGCCGTNKFTQGSF